jgi:aminoglycoside phosphotransferase
MGERLVIEGGPTVELQDRPSQGTRHEVSFGVLAGTGVRVAVKLERMPGSLERERVALGWLGARGGLVPRLLAAGMGVIGEQRVRCLVTERRPGSPPVSIEGWRRMGQAYAGLSEQRALPAELPLLDRVAFGRTHAQRIRDLGDRLAPLLASIPDWQQLSSNEVPGSPPLIITHGDPGPGNFLDDGQLGAVIDWEEAQIAPRGLDLARLVFIALLGAGPSGFDAYDHRERAQAAVDGYLDAVRHGWQPSREEWRWWITAAGIQFVHRRWQLDGWPAPWQDAAAVLHATLLKDTSTFVGRRGRARCLAGPGRRGCCPARTRGQ